MHNERVLQRGLSIVSECKDETGDIWHAYYGVAAIASYFFITENHLPQDIASRVATQADSMLDKYEFSRVRDELHPIDFTNAEKMILESLEKTMDHLHWVGHNVIYSALCLLAIRELGSWGTEDELIRIGQLIRSFEGTIPGRSWLLFRRAPHLAHITTENFRHIIRY